MRLYAAQQPAPALYPKAIIKASPNSPRSARRRTSATVGALPDGSTRGGHVVEAYISLTLQLFMDEAEPQTAAK